MRASEGFGREEGKETRASGDRGITRQRHKGLGGWGGGRWGARGFKRWGLKEWQIVSHLEQICILETSAVMASTCALHKTVKRLLIKVHSLCCHGCCWRMDKSTETQRSWKLEPGDTFNIATLIKLRVCTAVANSLRLTAEGSDIGGRPARENPATFLTLAKKKINKNRRV